MFFKTAYLINTRKFDKVIKCKYFNLFGAYLVKYTENNIKKKCVCNMFELFADFDLAQKYFSDLKEHRTKIEALGITMPPVENNDINRWNLKKLLDLYKHSFSVRRQQIKTAKHSVCFPEFTPEQEKRAKDLNLLCKYLNNELCPNEIENSKEKLCAVVQQYY